MLAATTVFGLLAAMVGAGGVWWELSWLTLATPLVLIILFAARATRNG